MGAYGSEGQEDLSSEHLGSGNSLSLLSFSLLASGSGISVMRRKPGGLLQAVITDMAVNSWPPGIQQVKRRVHARYKFRIGLTMCHVFC